MPVPMSNQGAESKRWLVPLLAMSREADERALVDPPGDCISWTATAKQALARGKGKAARQ